MPLLSTILASLPGGKSQGVNLNALLSLPLRPTQRNLARFDGPWAHTHGGHQAVRAYDFAALNLVDPCEVVPHEHNLAWAGNGTFLPKSSRQQPGGERWVA